MVGVVYPPSEGQSYVQQGVPPAFPQPISELLVFARLAGPLLSLCSSPRAPPFMSHVAAPWLGPLALLSSASNAATAGGKDKEKRDKEASLTADGTSGAFPVKAVGVRSYTPGALTSASWARPDAVVVEINRISRLVRRLPDKLSQFYKVLTSSLVCGVVHSCLTT